MEIKASSIANNIRMIRTQYTGSFLITEGDTDSRLFKRFIDQDKCRISVSHSKQNSLKIIEILDRDEFNGAVAIVDADFDRILTTLPSSPNTVITDAHDLDMMMLNSPALDKIFDEYGSEEKINAVKDKHGNGKSVLDIFLDQASLMGCLRIVSIQKNYNLKFKECKHQKFFHAATLKLNQNNLVKTILDHSQKHDLDEASIVEECTKVFNFSYNKNDLCSGHDVNNLVAISLRKTLGTCSSRIDRNTIELSLRIGYEEEYFKRTKLYKTLILWEQRNKPFKVVK